MAIGRTFGEVAAEGAALAGDRPDRLRRDRAGRRPDRDPRRAGPRHAGPAAHRRPGDAATAFRWTRSSSITGYDPWFLGEIETIIQTEKRDRERTACPRTPRACAASRAMGFSDARLAKLTGQKEAQVRAARHALGVRPCFKRIDTCAAEFAALTPYMYSTYETPVGGEAECESRSHRQEEDHHPGRRPQPHRPGHRVRLLLLPRRLLAVGAGL